MWSHDHPNRGCPDSIAALRDYVNDPRAVDSWGNPFHLQCAGTLGVLVTSAGDDGKWNTADDISGVDR